MQKKTLLAVLVVASLGRTSTHAQVPAQSSPDEQTIRQSAVDYCSAYNSGDIDGVLAYWANNSDYIDEQGETYRGKSAIGALFKNAAEVLKGHKLDLKIESIRFVKPDVAIEDGVASLTDPEGETTTGGYTTVWVKTGDKWLINSVRELPAVDEPGAEKSVNNLEPLAWLLGAWVSDDQGPTVNLNSKWALENSFLVQDYTVTGDDGADISVVKWIGFDPLTGQIKSWTFDSRGGYGEGLLSRDGNTWQEETTGVLPDGRVGTARNSVHFVDDTHFEWRSTDRNVEGQPMPDVKVRFARSGSPDTAGTP